MRKMMFVVFRRGTGVRFVRGQKKCRWIPQRAPNAAFFCHNFTVPLRVQKLPFKTINRGERAPAGDGGRRFAWLAVCCCCIVTVLSDCGGVWLCSDGVNESVLARGNFRQGLAKLFLHKQRLRKGRLSGATMAVQGLTGTLHRILSAGELALWACSNSNLTT
jgi:hypothetical protein